MNPFPSSARDLPGDPDGPRPLCAPQFLPEYEEQAEQEGRAGACSRVRLCQSPLLRQGAVICLFDTYWVNVLSRSTSLPFGQGSRSVSLGVRYPPVPGTEEVLNTQVLVGWVME